MMPDAASAMLRQLESQRVRTLLTLLGIILGVGTLVTLSSVIAGFGQFLQQGMQQATGDDIVNVNRTWDENAAAHNARPLDRFDVRALATDPGLAGSQTLPLYSKHVPWGNRWGNTIWVVGTAPGAEPLYRLETAKGRFLAQGDLFEHSSVAVLGPDAATKLLPGVGDPVGQTIKVNGERFRVIGELAHKPAIGAGSNWSWMEAVVIPQTTFIDRMAYSKDLSTIVVKAAPAVLAHGGLAQAVGIVRAILLNRHDQVENFRLTDPRQAAGVQTLVNVIVGGLELAIAGVCLVVGGINLMNIMLVSVLQRTREIGIRRALGATRSDIRQMFLSEAVALAGLGGLLGITSGSALAWLLAKGLAMAFGFWPYVFVPLPALAGFVSSLITGVAFGLYPAHRAANQPVIDCLRYD